MLLIREGIFAAVTLAFAAQPVAAQDAVQPLQPISAWTLDFGDNYCALRGAFGNEDEPVYLEMRQFRTAYDFQISVLGEGLSSRDRPVEYRMSPGSDWREVAFATPLRLQNGGAGVQFTGNLLTSDVVSLGYGDYLSDPRYREREAEISTIGIRNALKDEIHLAVGPLDDVMEVMRDCTDDLMNRWGLDPEVYRTITRPVLPRDQRGWARNVVEDYPWEMVRAGESGTVSLAVVVGADGAVERCIVTASTAHAGLQQGACEAMIEHAEFEPALDGNGEPTRDIWSTNVTYSIHP